MLHNGEKIFLIILLLFTAVDSAFCQQRSSAATDVISEESLRASVSFLTEDFCTGRASGSAGALEAASWVRRQFIEAGLMPMGNDYVQSFTIRRNVTSTFATSPQTPMLRYHAQPLDSASFCLAVPPFKPAPAVRHVSRKNRQPKVLPADEHARFANASARRTDPLPIDFRPYYNPYKEARNIQGRNIIGFLPGKEDRYLIVAAHYDNLGVLGGKMYPGADSNASGVAALTALATTFGRKAAEGNGYPMNIIFVALDAKQHSMAGSEELWNSINSGMLRNPQTGLPITKKKIAMFVNLDILGATESPLHKERPDYLIMLSTDTGKFNTLTRWCNRTYDIYLDLAFDYYGSKSFTDMFLKRVSDQKAFIEGGVPAVMFTSGITMTTNKTEDTAATIDFPILRKRTLLVFHWLDKAIYQF